MKVIRLLLFLLIPAALATKVDKRALQKSHEKSQLEKWEEKFLRSSDVFDQTASLVNLLHKISDEYLMGCTPIILYDIFTESGDELLLEKLLRNFPVSYVHGQITETYQIKVPRLIKESDTCTSYILFLKDVMRCKSIIGPQSSNKVIIVARSSQWRVYEFLANDVSQSFMNLLVIAKSEKIVTSQTELPYILYTHKFYVDALGSSVHQVLTSWKNSRLTRPHISLFPKKIVEGFAGHRFLISVANQPPFVIKKSTDENDDVQWDGTEIRLVNLLSKMFNFTTDYREAREFDVLGAAEAVTNAIINGKANLGIAGLYVTSERYKNTDTSYMHSQDCASFISLTSTALPRYRAIMGPFHWSVWLSLTIVYLFAIFPLSFSDKHTLRPLLDSPEEMENMFWYVFGTFTNCFTFVGHKSWSKSDKVTTRVLIGNARRLQVDLRRSYLWVATETCYTNPDIRSSQVNFKSGRFYWLFTIIVTACYTGSIIAFVTLPVYPSTVDKPEQLVRGHYQIGTLDRGGWEYWFENLTDPVEMKLFKNVDLVPDVESGLKNTTKAFFWPYALLASRAQLDYIVRTNFTTTNKRSLLHISSECFVPFTVTIIYNKNSLFGKIIDDGVLRIVQSGLMMKLKSDVEWETMRSATGKLLAANSFGKSLSKLTVEDRALTLDDTQGMFLLLGAGFALGGASLLSEWLGGCFHLCKRRRPSTAVSIESNYRSHGNPTPREKLDSLQNNSLNDHRNSKTDNSTGENKNCSYGHIVHANVDHHADDIREDKGNSAAAILSEVNSNSSDFEEEISRLFKFEDVFGEEGTDKETEEELLVDDTSDRKSN